MKFGIVEVIWFIILLLIVGVIILIFWKGKDLLKFRAFQGGFFKQLAFWTSSPQDAQKVLFYRETGHISAELLPMYTGYMVDFKSMRAWLALNPLKYEVYVNGKPTNESVYLVSERSYLPLDPNNRLTSEEIEKLASLEDIAVTAAVNAILNAAKPDDPTTLQIAIVNGSFVMMAIFGVLAFVLRKWA